MSDGMKWTPGKWSVPHFATAKDENDCRCTYVLAEGYYGAICSVHIHNGIQNVTDGSNDCPPEAEAKANAHLIAAAPDLYAALQELLAAGDAYAAPGNTSDTELMLRFGAATEAAYAALAKARGES